MAAGPPELAGLVLDKVTEEPLFDFELRLWMEGMPPRDSRSLRTDEQGRFSFGALEHGGAAPNGFVLTLTDHPAIPRSSTDHRRRFRRAGPEGAFPLPLRLAVAVGPTFALELELPEGLGTGDFEAGLLPGPPGLDRDFERTATGLRGPLSIGPHPGLSWVRFGAPTRIRDRAWIEVRSLDQRWRGGAWVTQLQGVAASPVPIRLEASTRAFGRFTWPAQAEQHWVRLRLAELEDGQVSGRPLHGSAGESGELAFEFLRPGRYRLWTADAGWRPFELEFEAQPGENDLGTHELVPRPVKGTLAGVLRSASGRFDGACHVSLSDRLMEHGAPFDHSLDFEPLDPENEDSELVAYFEFQNVTEGDWWLYVHCHDGFDFPDSAVRVRAPNESLEILLQDRAMVVRVEIVEADGGAPCAAAWFYWSCGEARERGQGASLELQPLPDAPERLRWLAWAPGRRLAQGTGLDFERRELADGRLELFGRVELSEGFGRRLVAQRRYLGTPLAGVEVRCDGELAGITGPDGVLDLHRDARPGRLTLTKAGWFHVSNAGLNARTGGYSEEPVLIADFEPEQP